MEESTKLIIYIALFIILILSGLYCIYVVKSIVIIIALMVSLILVSVLIKDAID